MKTEQWLAAFAVFVACGKSAESKQEKKEPAKTEDKPAASDGSFSGFYKVESATMDGKPVDLAKEFTKSLKATGDAKLEVDFVRMTMEIEGPKLTIGLEQVFGSPGSATFCAVHSSTEVELSGTKLTVPAIEAVASAGIVTSKGGSETKDTAKCNAAFKKGTYELTFKGKNVDISTTSGDVTLHLVPDEKVVDLKARAVAFAARK